MPDAEVLKFFSGMGIGGSIAALIFMFYRKDMKANAEMWQGQSQMLMQVVKENTAAITALIQVVDERRSRR